MRPSHSHSIVYIEDINLSDIEPFIEKTVEENYLEREENLQGFHAVCRKTRKIFYELKDNGHFIDHKGGIIGAHMLASILRSMKRVVKFEEDFTNCSYQGFHSFTTTKVCPKKLLKMKRIF